MDAEGFRRTELHKDAGLAELKATGWRQALGDQLTRANLLNCQQPYRTIHPDCDRVAFSGNRRAAPHGGAAGGDSIPLS